MGYILPHLLAIEVRGASMNDSILVASISLIIYNNMKSWITTLCWVTSIFLLNLCTMNCEVHEFKSNIALNDHTTKILHDSGSDYEVETKIGKGNFGEVYIGKNLNNSEKVAIKLERLPLESITLPGSHGDDIGINVSMSREYETYQLLGSHQGIPQIYFLEKFNDYNVLVMELLGPSLNDVFKMSGFFCLQTILEIAVQVIDLLKYIHSKHLVHLDIKPQNILIGTRKKEHILHIVDFGLSKKYFDSETGKHIPLTFKRGRGRGTIYLQSLNSHIIRDQSRQK